MSAAGSKADGQVLKGLLDTLVLGVLSEGDSYGFAILQQIEQRLEDALVLKEATLYPLLHRLEEKALLECYWRPGDRGTDRKYYRITDSGRDFLAARIAEWERVASILQRSVLKTGVRT
jgi:PadR family transcriptional regulator PadR